jgi:hypothetical protein
MRAEPIRINWHPGMSVYASEQFLQAVGDKYGWLGGFDAFGKLCCILPYTIIRKASVQMARFRVETIFIGEELKVEEEKIFLNSVVDYFRSIGIDMIIPATTNAIFRTYPEGAIAAPYGTLIIDLDQPEEGLWANVHSKHRNVIRKAKKEGVRIICDGDYIDAAFKLVRDTFKRSRLPFMNHYAFKRMICGLADFVRVFIADYQGVFQGCAVIPFSKHSAYYVYGGSTSKPMTGAMNLLQWEAILYFRALGVKHYDFCGVRIDPEKESKQARLMMFKERFGPKLIRGYMWKQSLNRLKSPLYTLSVRLLRGGDIVDAERHKLTRV